VTAGPDVFDDLEDEEERLEGMLAGLVDEQWLTESDAPGWTVADVVLHLAQSEELVVATLGGPVAPGTAGFEAAAGSSMDEMMDAAVRAQRASGPVVLERWRRGRRHALDRLRAAPGDEAVPWAAAPLRPGTLATTRLAEHWAHGLDITTPLGLVFEDTRRLRHVAWLAHRSLPYAFSLQGEPPPPVRCDLTFGTEHWTFGPPEAPSRIEGEAGEFCRVAARRLPAAKTGLRASGPYGATALAVLRTYAA
jgi:uncharacterized protein (TIGR03084 family)